MHKSQKLAKMKTTRVKMIFIKKKNCQYFENDFDFSIINGKTLKKKNIN